MGEYGTPKGATSMNRRVQVQRRGQTYERKSMGHTEDPRVQMEEDGTQRGDNSTREKSPIVQRGK